MTNIQKAQKTTIFSIMTNRYGAAFNHHNPVVVLWAAERAVDEIGVEAARKELKLVNSARRKIGIPDAFPEYGSRLFPSRSAV